MIVLAKRASLTGSIRLTLSELLVRLVWITQAKPKLGW